MLAQVSIFPVGSGEALAKEVAKIIDIIDNSGLSYKTTAMATIIEGDWDDVMALVKKCHHTMRESHSRVYTSIVIDDREGAKNRLTGKVEDVEKEIKRKLKT